MARFHAAPTAITQPPGHELEGNSFEALPFGEVEISDVVNGMVNRLPRSQVPQGSAYELKNARIRDDWTGRRPGTGIFGPPGPNSSIVLKMITFVFESGDFVLCRITTTSFHILDATLSTWIPFEILDEDGEPTTFIGQRVGVSFTQYFDKLYLADGIHKIWEVDFDDQTVQQIEEAPIAKYITTYGNRIIAGNVGFEEGGLRPASLAWSANATPRDWTSVSAGREDLSESNIGDEITGVFATENDLVIIRRTSIWHGSRQPFAGAPFRFTPVIANMGSDLPYSITRVPGGLIYADQRTRDVYFYTPGAAPQGLAKHLNRTIFEDLRDVKFCAGAFDPFEKEYHLGLVTDDTGFIDKVWVYALEYGAWGYDDGPEVSTIGVVSIPGEAIAIQDLIGIIDVQDPPPTGAIDDYGQEGGFFPTLVKGTAEGRVIVQRYAFSTDWNDVNFQFEFQSPNMGSVSKRRTIKDLSLSVDSGMGSYTLEHSVDRGEWRNSLTTTIPIPVQGRPLLRLPKTQITGNDLYWRLLSTAPGLRIYSWWVRLLEKGRQR